MKLQHDDREIPNRNQSSADSVWLACTKLRRVYKEDTGIEAYCIVDRMDVYSERDWKVHKS